MRCISCAALVWSLAYLVRSSWICGWISCILREERSWVMVGLTMMALSVHVSRTMAMIQVPPHAESRTKLKSQCQNHKTAEIGQ